MKFEDQKHMDSSTKPNHKPVLEKQKFLTKNDLQQTFFQIVWRLIVRKFENKKQNEQDCDFIFTISKFMCYLVDEEKNMSNFKKCIQRLKVTAKTDQNLNFRF